MNGSTGCLRRLRDTPMLFRKGSEGAKALFSLLKQGGHAAMLVDQKMNDGIAVPFFGRDAMTAPAIAQFAVRLGCVLVPVRTERLKGARFRITVYPPLDLPATGDRDRGRARNHDPNQRHHRKLDPAESRAMALVAPPLAGLIAGDIVRHKSANISAI